MKIRGQIILDPRERIKCSVEIDEQSGCWNWIRASRPGKRPYGRLVVGSRSDGSRRTTSAHRYAFEIFNGPIPEGMHVCHHCDNARCCNPSHLFLGTAKDNADDRDRKGRNKAPPHARGGQSPSARLTDEQVGEIRSSPLSSRALAPIYGISDSHIRAIRRGKYFTPEPPHG